MLRIISGKFKNRKIQSPKGMETRPTSDRLRGAVFNMLQQQIEGVDFLDLFAGSGAMGIEAISRGARRVVLVDQGRAAIEVIRENLETLGVGREALVMGQDVFRALDYLEGKGETFDVIYVDPPYTERKGIKGIGSKILERIDRGKLLKRDGELFIEESQESELEKESLSQLKFIEQRVYGRPCLYRYRLLS